MGKALLATPRSTRWATSVQDYLDHTPDMLAVTSVSKREGALICRITYRDAKRKPNWRLFTDVPTKLISQYYLARFHKQKAREVLRATSAPSSGLPAALATIGTPHQSKLLFSQHHKTTKSIIETVVSVRKTDINRNNSNRVNGRRLRISRPQLRSKRGNSPKNSRRSDHCRMVNRANDYERQTIRKPFRLYRLFFPQKFKFRKKTTSS